MKYSQMPERQATALLQFYISIVQIAANEQFQYTSAALRLLLVGNAAGVAILASALTGLYQSNTSSSELIPPLVLFLLGVTFSGFLYLQSAALASGAARHIGISIEKMFNDQIDIDDLQAWGLNRVGKAVFAIASLLSLTCFAVGTSLSICAYAT